MVNDLEREALIMQCANAIVQQDKWHDRDSQSAQLQIGKLWALLKAGCEYVVLTPETSEYLISDADTIWISVRSRSFADFEEGRDASDVETFYLPTAKRLEAAAGRDWY